MRYDNIIDSMGFCRHVVFTLFSQDFLASACKELTHWGRVTHICVSNLTITSSDNGLSPGRRQAIIWTNAGILLIGPLGTNFSEILIEINTFSFKKMRLKMPSAKWRPFCLGLNELIWLNYDVFPTVYITRPWSEWHAICCSAITTKMFVISSMRW